MGLLLSGWAGPVAMETGDPWNLAYPTDTPIPVGNMADRFLEGLE